LLQRLRENLWVFSFEAVTPTDRHVYAIGYQSLDEADEKMAADHAAVLELAQVASRIKVAHASMASADPSIYEYTTMWTPIGNRSFAAWPPRWRGLPPRANATSRRNGW
jgi:hypothetical protein